MRRRFNMELKNGIGILAVLAIVGVWYIFYYGAYAKESSPDASHYSTKQKTTHFGTHLFALIEDGDSQTRPSEKTWGSMYAIGRLEVEEDGSANMEIINNTILEYSLAEGNRGMELSELQKFAGELLAVDDRSGVVYSIENDIVVPRYILVDGNGHSKKGFKGEWMTVKDHVLYVGGFGKPWTTPTGDIVNYDPMWVKVISPDGVVEHRFWKKNYEALMRAAGISYPGYIYYEAVCWSAIHEKWFFLPRRVSPDKYDDKKDEQLGSNILLVADELFKDIEIRYIGPKIPTHGFSSFKFLPYSNDNIIVALKTEEVDGAVKTFMTLFTVDGKTTLMSETLIGDKKFEGIEFL
ncbi:soluble calcium-activated nucleotidase 1-like isoform X2 [Bolinopsis microptera]|uniref:soluble calcium-activated nucleotidase 1-like isoform X2 n=1 Tax=Bolinopsis microptera TaxID=2820187 RepID=UPI00307A4411